ncbi:MAG: V-type ATPase subunit subunit G family protein [Candidatus Edwardsbacteria bacterium]|nr:V-type ATPase subunit subunit G family protein [Candidatus Edwardsbacteria bacterium]
MSSEKHNDQQDQAQQIISSLAQREQELQQKTEEAKAEADRIIEKAKAEASAILNNARSRMDENNLSGKKETAQKALQLIEQKKKQAAAQAGRLEQQAAAKQDQAVELIIKQVFPENG